MSASHKRLGAVAKKWRSTRSAGREPRGPGDGGALGLAPANALETEAAHEAGDLVPPTLLLLRRSWRQTLRTP